MGYFPHLAADVASFCRLTTSARRSRGAPRSLDSRKIRARSGGQPLISGASLRLTAEGGCPYANLAAPLVLPQNAAEKHYVALSTALSAA
jgi:hypothetical protein